MAEKDTSKDYFSGSKYRVRVGPFIEAAHPDEVAYSWLSYDLSRYFFEATRNFLVVGALRYAADKTGNIFLMIMFYISLCAFVMFVYSFLCFWDLKIFSHLFPKSSAGPVLDGFLNVLFSAALTMPLYFLIITITGQMEALKQ
jgi:hypothetical protein